MSKPVVGIDLGASKIALGLVDEHNKIAASRRFPTEPEKLAPDAARRIQDAVMSMIAETDLIPAAVGVCSPGPVDVERGVILDPPNLTGWVNAPFRDILSKQLHLPVTLEHDAKASALGEFYFGAGRTHAVRDLVYFIIGTGVGAAYLLDGQLYRGRHNSAGEVGHITLDRRGKPGSSGVPGCVESFMSGPSLAKLYQGRIDADEDRNQPLDRQLNGQRVVELAQQGDANALAVMAEASDALAAGIATIAMVMDMDFFVVGGSVARAGELLLAPARAAVSKYGFQSVTSRIRIVQTELHETGAILGCAWQARQLLAKRGQ